MNPERFQSDMWLSLSGAGYIVVYSIDDLASFRNAEQALYELRQRIHTSHKPIILVANKIDLERKRLVTAEGEHMKLVINQAYSLLGLCTSHPSE